MVTNLDEHSTLCKLSSKMQKDSLCAYSREQHGTVTETTTRLNSLEAR